MTGDHKVKLVVKGDEQMTHTPGPWTVGNAHGWDMPIVESDGHRIATMERNNYRPLTARSAPAKAEDEANARLIAAAPDLLAALEKIAGVASLDENFRESQLATIQTVAHTAIKEAKK